MHLLSIPRHQIETNFLDYLGIAGSLFFPATRPSTVNEFEDAFARYICCRHAIAVSSGRLGMHLILEALEPHAGSEAIVPAFNLSAVIERFCQLGIRPRFCDIQKTDLNLNAAQLEQLLTPNTQFVLATHMFGHPADVVRLKEFAHRHGLILLEDCAHALGSQVQERMVGTFGRASIFSFSVLKLVTTFGGGMIATDDDHLANRVRQRLAQSRSLSSWTVATKKALTGMAMDLGTRNAPFSFCAWPALRLMRALRPNLQQQIMTETPQLDRGLDPDSVPPLHPFQARLGISQLRHVEQIIEQRRQVGRWLDEELSGIGQISLLQSSAMSRHNGLYYGILAERAAELAEYLFRRGIDCETSEYRNCARLDIYYEFGGGCPIARDVESKILRLPNYPSLSWRNVRRIGDAIRMFYRQSGT